MTPLVCKAAIALALFAVAVSAQDLPEWLHRRVEDEATVKSGLVRVFEGETLGDRADEVAQVTVSLPYLDIEGRRREGKARLFVREADIAGGKRAPGMMFAHYECDPAGAALWARRGWAVATTHENGEHCLGNSFNLDLALLEWLRRLPFIDRKHVAIVGGSAGGYMTLAMAAEGFPIAAASADVPVLNWAYNVAYLVKNAPPAQAGVLEGGDFSKSRLPVVFVVIPIAEDAQKLFGDGLSLAAWRQVSPVSYIDRITCPVSMTFSTADLLVPMPQLSVEHTALPDPKAFPEGFEMRMDVLTEIPAMRRTMLQRLPKRKRRVFVHKIPPDYHEIDPLEVVGGEKQPEPPPPLDRPWDARRQWSIVIFDEGPATPKTGHFRYLFQQTPDSFMAHYREAPLSPTVLNQAKLRRLMERYTDSLSDAPVLRGGGAKPRAIHRLNFPALERLDVVTGLLDYAECGPEFEARLRNLYRGLPKRLKAFGPRADLSELRGLRERLWGEAGGR